MEERQVDDAIRVTEEKLRVLKSSVEKRKVEGKKRAEGKAKSKTSVAEEVPVAGTS